MTKQFRVVFDITLPVFIILATVFTRDNDLCKVMTLSQT